MHLLHPVFNSHRQRCPGTREILRMVAMIVVRSLVLAILLLLPSIGSAAEPSLPNWVTAAGGAPWRAPKEGVIRDEKSAIGIARIVWLSMNPDIAARIGSESVWQTEMTATLRDGVWEVKRRSRPGELGGGLVIYISASDARILGIF